MTDFIPNFWQQIEEPQAWLIFLFPLGAFLVNSLIIRPFFNQYSKLSGWITVVSLTASFVLSVYAVGSVAANDGRSIGWASHEWVEVANFKMTVGIMMNSLTALMLLVVTGVSLLVQIYSMGYMKGDSGYSRYFAYMSLFTASMVGLVMSSNIVQLFVFWELVGLCSFLLIGFWFHKPSAAAAAKKAFLVTRVGDFGFLLGILYLFSQGDSFTANNLNPLEIRDIEKAIGLGTVISSSVAGWIALGFFLGAMGKSGQFPLHTWLPDAMEGPTPVSSLIHAATMVAAGVFLVARFFPLFEASPVALDTVAIIGGVTVVFAASMGLVMNDIKRVLAYSTVSQLGYMMLAIGVGAPGVAIFHLFTHAFFKCLLFQGAGSVSHAVGGTFDMRYMGGLRRVMPWTYATFLIGSLSLAGIFPLAGFWSKDEILASAQGQAGFIPQAVFGLALIAVTMTAFYMFRVLFMTFEGDYKGGADADPDVESHAPSNTPRESAWSMLGPMVILALLAIFAGFVANPIVNLGAIPEHWLVHDFLHESAAKFNLGIAAISTFAAILGILLAYLMYLSKTISAQTVVSSVRPIHTVLSRKYYFDELYEDLLTTRVFYRGLAGALDWFDRCVVDGLVRVIDNFGRNIGRLIGQAQTGQVQSYGAVLSGGVLVILGVLLFLK